MCAHSEWKGSMTCGFVSGLQIPYELETGATGALPITAGIPIGHTYILQNKGWTALSPRISRWPGECPADARVCPADRLECPADPCECSANPRECSAGPRKNVPQIRVNVPQIRANVPQFRVNDPQFRVNDPRICALTCNPQFRV